MRLYRAGYRISTIAKPTLEDAPLTYRVWLRQRTRWYKGWLQTWLVHNRSPLATARQLGFKSSLIAQILFAGLLISALAHPVMLLTITGLAAKLLAHHTLSGVQLALLAVDTVNIALGYSAFLLLGSRTLLPAEKAGLGKIVAATPVYWMAMSIAAWRSVWQIFRAPFHWEKTPHQPWRADGSIPRT